MNECVDIGTVRDGATKRTFGLENSVAVHKITVKMFSAFFVAAQKPQNIQAQK